MAWQEVMDWLVLADWILVPCQRLPEFNFHRRVDVGSVGVDANLGLWLI